MSNEIKTHYRACNLCEAICGIVVKTQGREVVSIRGDENDPLSQGHICPKAMGLKDLFEDKDRLRQPVRKTENGWEKISWEEAYDTVAQKINESREKYGNDSVGVYLGNPNAHNTGAIVMNPMFLRALRTKNKFSATSADQLPHHIAGRFMFGHFFLLPIPDIDRTDYMIIMGANPMASNGSIMTVPNVGKRLRAIQERGGKVVVVDPRRTETSRKADEHVFVRPGKDVFLLLGMVHHIIEQGWADLGKLQDFTDGLDELKNLVEDFTVEEAARISGVPAETIKQLAKDLSQTKRAVCYGRMGLSTQAYGGLCIWLINVINIITGHFDTEGGMMFTAPAFDNLKTVGVGKHSRWKSRVSGYDEYFGELPVVALAEEIETEGPGQIKTMITIAGNPVLSIPNGKRLEESFKQLDFMVAIDIYINETTSHADIILPSTNGLETLQYDLVFHSFAVRNTAKVGMPVFDRLPEQRHDYEILGELTKRVTGNTAMQLPPLEMMLDMGLQSGPYGISMQQLKNEPSGIDLGALKPCLPGRLFNEEKRIQLCPPEITKDMARAKSHLGKNDTEELVLIGRRQLRSNNSWMHNSYRLVKGKNRCTLLIHPNDAEKFKVENEQIVKVHSRVGSVEIQAEVSDEIMEGVVSIPHGWGHNRKGNRMEVAQAHAGVSINDLTDEQLVDSLTGNAAFSGVPVTVVPMT